MWPAWGGKRFRLRKEGKRFVRLKSVLAKRFGLCGPLPAKCFSSPNLKRESASPLKGCRGERFSPESPGPRETLLAGEKRAERSASALRNYFQRSASGWLLE